MTPENLLTEWARLLVETLADAGVSDVVVSPGSRSTPLVWAALGSPRLRCTSVIDERAAGFYALGIARVTGHAAAVVCTSGSALANYFPAIVEARMARLPLLVVTADRPFELQDCGASQTLDQTKIYGDFVRKFVDLGMPDAEHAALLGLRRRTIQSVLETTSGEPGAVHVNVRARKPIEATAAATEAAHTLRAEVDALLQTPVVRAPSAVRVADDEAIQWLARACRDEPEGVIVCGPAQVGAESSGKLIGRVSSALGYPVFAEATSQLRFDGTTELGEERTLDALDVLLCAPSFRDGFRPKIVLQIGEPPVSASFERFASMARARGTARHVIAPFGFPDPHGTAASLTIADVPNTLERLAAALPERAPSSSSWLASLRRANTAAWRSVDAMLSAEPGLSEGAAVRAVIAAMPAGAVLVAGNSLPVRHLDAYCQARPEAHLAVVSQRGVAGIDGVVSGAAGTACAARRPTVLIVGDVSALHDLGGFAVAQAVDVPFVVVILNNDGGRIFDQLPLGDARLEPNRMRFWTTPHGTHFDGLPRLFGLAYDRATTLPDLSDALHRGLSRSGATVVEADVPPDGARELQSKIAAHVEAALG